MPNANGIEKVVDDLSKIPGKLLLYISKWALASYYNSIGSVVEITVNVMSMSGIFFKMKK